MYLTNKLKKMFYTKHLVIQESRLGATTAEIWQKDVEISQTNTLTSKESIASTILILM